MAKDSAKVKKGAEKRAKKDTRKETKKETKKEAKKETKKQKATAEGPEEVETAPELETPEPLKAELEQPTPGEEAKEITEEKAEELKQEEKPEEVEEEAERGEAVEEEEEELEIVEEKFYDLNLRRIWAAPRESRTPKAVRFLRDFVARRMKTDEVSISEEANRMLWARGISKPPRHIRVRAVKDKDGRVIVFPGEVK